MFRIGSQLKNRCNSFGRATLRSQKACNLSTSADSGSAAAKSALIATGLVLTGGVATVGLAWQKPEIRKTIELNAPPTHYLFDAILGPLNKSKVYPPSGKPKTVDPFDAPLRSVRRSIEDSSSQETKQNAPVNKDENELTTKQNPVEEPVVPEEQHLDSSQDSIEQPEPKLDESLTQSNTEQTEDFLIVEDEGKELEVTETTEQAESPETVIIISEMNSEDSNEENQSDKSEDSLPTFLVRSPEEVQESLIKLEEDVLADANAMTAILDEALATCAQRCADAIESNIEASKAIALHTAILRSAMDDSSGKESKSEEWTDVSKIFEQKSRLQNEAEIAYQEANEELKKLNSIVEEVKKTNNSAINRSIIKAEENSNAMRKELEESLSEVNSKISESQVISQYKDLVETAKEQFRKELLSVMPDVKIEPGWRGLSRKLSQDDLNALIAHAHRRVDQLQRELAEERAISARRMEKAVQMAKEQWEQQADLNIKKKTEILKEEMEIEHDRKTEEARLAFEREMRVQLKRQAAAHSDHLTEMLSLQESQLKAELNENFNIALEEQQKEFDKHLKNLKHLHENELNEIKDGFQFNLNKALARVAGVETAVDGRAYIDNESRKAQELWLACEALRIALRYGNQGEPIPLQAELNTIAQIHGVEAAVKEVVVTFPEQARERGVFTEESLRNSYKQVSKMCRRLSLVSETRNTLFAYFISYLKSFLIISQAQNKPPDDLDLESLDTFQILSYANYSIERGDLEQATRFMNQLKGEPRRVAQGWIKEARLLLETRQTVQALSALATAISIAANLET